MNNYYFTFGSSHYTTSGQPMENHWVRVVAADYDQARGLFIRNFTSTQMEAPDKFSFQYDDHNFKSWLYPAGEFLVIE